MFPIITPQCFSGSYSLYLIGSTFWLRRLVPLPLLPLPEYEAFDELVGELLFEDELAFDDNVAVRFVVLSKFDWDLLELISISSLFSKTCTSSILDILCFLLDTLLSMWAKLTPVLLSVCIGDDTLVDTLRRFENAADKDVDAPDSLLLLELLSLPKEPAVELAFDANSDAIRIFVLGAGTIFEPWAFLTCRNMPSGAITWLHWLHNTIGPGSLGDTP